MERLQKVLAAAGVASRRKSEDLILSGRVSVNGQIVKELGVKVDASQDRIEIDQKPIQRQKLRYLLLFKPRGVVTTASDPEGRKTVIDLVRDIPERVYPVGRLDIDTTGLLLLTNDGALAHGLMHPSREIHKTYLAKVAGNVGMDAVSRLRSGVLLEDGMTAPAKVRIKNRLENSTTLEIVIHEGRNRQVRRMCEAVGHPVLSLMRTQVAFLKLGALKPKEYRELSDSEVQELYRLTGIK